MTDNVEDSGPKDRASAPEVVVSIDIEAPPKDVWRTLTSDEGVARWLGAGSSIGDRVGDDIDVCDVATGQRRCGVLDEVSPGQRLGYTWWPETRPSDATRVVISIEQSKIGTRVTVVETRPLTPISASAAHTFVMSNHAAWAWRAALLKVASGMYERSILSPYPAGVAYG